MLGIWGFFKPEDGLLLLLVGVDTFFFPHVQRFAVVRVDLHADRVDRVIELFLNFDPIVLNVFWYSHFLVPKLSSVRFGARMLQTSIGL